MGDPQYIDIQTDSGDVLRVVYEVSMGDLLLAAVILLAVLILVLKAIIRIIWRW